MLKSFVLLLAAAFCLAAADSVKIVLVAGKASHGSREHEFNAGAQILAKCLRQNPGVEAVVVKDGWPADQAVFEGARALVFYEDGGAGHPMIQDNRLAAVGKLMRTGVGLACIHYAVEVPKERGGAELLEWIGGFYDRPYSQNPVNDVAVQQASPSHPISRGWKSFSGRDEWYYKIRFRPGDPRLIPILTTELPKDTPEREVVAWAVEREDGGRGFGFTGAHYHDNWGISDFRRMVVNAILWTAKAEIPAGGARCDITPAELNNNLDSKSPEK